MEKHECSLVGQAQVARRGQRRLAFDLIAEDRDSREVDTQGQLVRAKQRARRDREVASARLAAIPHGFIETTGRVGIEAAAMRAHRRAVRLRPTQRTEQRLGLHIAMPNT